jgi:hypothetical protein
MGEDLKGFKNRFPLLQYLQRHNWYLEQALLP